MLRKVIALTLSLVLVLSIAGVAASAETAGEEFVITNPYSSVVWEGEGAWGAYKTQLHCHTNASDGFLTISESVKAHYDRDYDIVAITDHGTLNRGWNNEPQLVPLLRYIKKERTKMADIIPLTAAEYAGYTGGTAVSETRTHSNGMIDVPLGIELNMATPVSDCHLTGYFAEYGQGLAGVYGDYETPSAGVNKAGGISMLSHVGEYVYPDKDTENHVGEKVDDYFANKFARLFIDNVGSSVGMGINSATDAHTRCDRILYDQVLQKTIPNGVVPWGFCFSDSHNDTSLNDAYQIMYMPSLSLENFRSCMVGGASFAVSHYSNGVELNGMAEMPGFDEQKVYDEKMYDMNNTPVVTKVSVDEANDTITIEGENFNAITWVSNCNVIKRETGISSGSATLDLHAADLLNNPELYVRFYITGENGICYSQPFTLNVKGETFEAVNVPKTHDTSTFLRGLVTLLDWTVFKYNPVVWAFKFFGLGYSVFDNFFNAY